MTICRLKPRRQCRARGVRIELAERGDEVDCLHLVGRFCSVLGAVLQAEHCLQVRRQVFLPASHASPLGGAPAGFCINRGPTVEKEAGRLLTVAATCEIAAQYQPPNQAATNRRG